LNLILLNAVDQKRTELIIIVICKR